MPLLKNPVECKKEVPAECDRCGINYMMKKGHATANINKGRKSFYCSNKCVNPPAILPKPCQVCNKLTPYPNKYCSKVCSGKNTGHFGGLAASTPDARKIKSIIMKELYQDSSIRKKIWGVIDENGKLVTRSELYDRAPNRCKICSTPLSYQFRNNKTCGDKRCISKALSNGHANKKTTRRSKKEIELFKLCETQWDVEPNPIIFDGYDADIVIRDLKIAIMWDGPWHYREMPGLIHSLKQVHNRDQYRDRKLKELGWKVFHFRDDEWTPESAFMEITAWVAGDGFEPS